MTIPAPRPPEEGAQIAVAGWRVVSVQSGTDRAATTLLRGGAVLMGGPATVTAATDDGLTAIVDVGADDTGRLVAIGVRLSRTDGGAVDSRALRRVPVGAIVRAVVADDPVSAIGQRRMDGEARMAAVVETWRQFMVDPHNRRRATAATADALHLSRGYVTRLLTRARNEGLIPPHADRQR